jgi:hypothetical protein
MTTAIYPETLEPLKHRIWLNSEGQVKVGNISCVLAARHEDVQICNRSVVILSPGKVKPRSVPIGPGTNWAPEPVWVR